MADRGGDERAPQVLKVWYDAHGRERLTILHTLEKVVEFEVTDFGGWPIESPTASTDETEVSDG